MIVMVMIVMILMIVMGSGRIVRFMKDMFGRQRRRSGAGCVVSMFDF